MAPASSDVLIAGAGPTGLMLALWLTRLGLRVHIVDPKDGPTTETRAIAVQARTLEFYDQLGLGKEAIARGTHFERLSFFVQGRFKGSIKIGDLGADLTPHPYVYILTQDQNEQMLEQALRSLGVQVAWNTALVTFSQDAAGVTATLRRGEQEETVSATYLAGCDGGSSTVRQSLALDLSGGTYENRFYVADVTATGKLPPKNVNFFLDDTRFSIFFPLPEARHHRIVGQLPQDTGEQPDFERVRPEIEAHGLALIEQVHWFSSYRVHHRVAERFRVGRAFLLGDAGHLHSPVGGQGMNTGLGDASNLAWKLAQTVRGGNPALLETYEPERRPFAVSLVNTTDRVFNFVIKPSFWGRTMRTRLIPLLPFLTRPSFVRRQLFLTVSQTKIQYVNSPLSCGRTGKLRGGERLPWVKTADGSNFDALKSLDWQVHVYGAAHTDLSSWCAERNLPLRTFPHTKASQKVGLVENAIYLIRPDGHIGLALPTFEQGSLEAYAERWLSLDKTAPKQSVK